jgi:hypothetical protein
MKANNLENAQLSIIEGGGHDTHRLIEQLNTISCCNKCKAIFLFESDIAEHSERFGGHDDFETMSFE